MTRARVTRAFVAGIALVAFTVGATGCAPTKDSAKGGFLFFAGDAEVRVDAASGPSSENPRGTVQAGSTGPFGPYWDWHVTCLNVQGNTVIAGITGTVTTNFDPTVIRPSAGLLRIVDGGGEDSQLDTVEWATTEGEDGDPPIPGPTTCSEFPADYGPIIGPNVNEDGNVVVTDAPPLPTSTRQCANDGWRTYRFENRAQCDAFVAQFQR
jgi:hypothetical protein